MAIRGLSRVSPSVKHLLKRSINNVRCMSTTGYNGVESLLRDPSLTEDQVQLHDLIHSFMKRELPPNVVAQIEKDDNYPGFRDLWKKLGSMGLHGITAPKQYGGLGLGFFEHCLAMEVISRYSGAIALSYGAHSNLNINQISVNGSEKQKETYLPKLIDGTHVGALAMSEPESGSDVTSMRTTAVKKGDYYVLNGSKFWITNGPIADVILVYAKTGPKDITAFLVEKDMPGFSVGKKISKIGMKGSPTGELIFEDCIVPESNIVGGLNQGVYVLMSGLDYERLVLAAGPLGLMKQALLLSCNYAHERKQFGQPIGLNQLMQGKMCDMLTKTLFCQSTLYSLARNLDSHLANKSKSHISKGTSQFSALCAAAILKLSEDGAQVVDEALQIFGGNGYTKDYEIGRMRDDVRLYGIGAGTNEIRRWLIGREINKTYLAETKSNK